MIMKKYIFFIFLIISIFYGCDTSSKYNLKNNISISNSFNDEEIIELEKIINFFDSIVLEKCNNKSVDSCYNSYFSNIKLAIKNKGELQLDTSGLYKFIHSVPKNIFDEIWYFTVGKARRNRFEKYRKKEFLEVSINGKYSNFLKEYSKTNNDINFYYQSFNMLGSVGASSNAKLITEYEKFDFNDESIRLIYAIHFIAQGYNLF